MSQNGKFHALIDFVLIFYPVVTLADALLYHQTDHWNNFTARSTFWQDPIHRLIFKHYLRIGFTVFKKNVRETFWIKFSKTFL